MTHILEDSTQTFFEIFEFPWHLKKFLGLKKSGLPYSTSFSVTGVVLSFDGFGFRQQKPSDFHGAGATDLRKWNKIESAVKNKESEEREGY